MTMIDINDAMRAMAVKTDGKTIGSIGSLASDYLVAFGIASINMQIVLTHAVPLVVFALLGLAICVGWLLLTGRSRKWVGCT